MPSACRRYGTVLNMLLRVLRVLLIIYVIIVCAEKCFKIRQDLNNADKVFLCETKKTFRVVRNIGSEQVTFRFNPTTSFFIFENMERRCRIGCYWRYLPLLEKKLKIPFVGSNKIQPNLTIEDTESVRDALKKLDSLPEFPLSTGGKLKLISEVLRIDDVL